MRFRPVVAFPALLLFTASLALGHYTWLVRTHYSTAGDTAYLEFGHGHDFPNSEEAPSINSVKAWLALPDGSKKPVELKPAGNVVKMEAKLPSKALARVFYERNRGVMSQTASGWKEGGRKKYPDAKASRKTIQYGIAWVGFTGTTNSARPLGLELEMNYESGIRGRLVRVYRGGKPARDVEVTAVLGDEKEVKLGKTDRDGYAKVESIPERVPVLFSANVTERASKGADYDNLVLSCTLSLSSE